MEGALIYNNASSPSKVIHALFVGFLYIVNYRDRDNLMGKPCFFGVCSVVQKVFFNVIRRFILIMAIPLLSGCLEFGDDIYLTAPDVDVKELDEVARHTGIAFPRGTVGLGYVFMGSGIDDALAIKVVIPVEEKERFLSNELFQSGSREACSIQIGKGQGWWTLERLTNRKDYKMNLPEGRYVECSFGKEGGRWVAYISWMAT